MDMTFELLTISEKDLKAAKVLYESRNYSQAVFYFQQSIEKLSKSYALFFGIIKENELFGSKGIGHRGTIIFEKNFSNIKSNYRILHEKIIDSPKPIGITKMKKLGLSKAIKNTTSLINVLQSYRTEPLSIVNMPKKEISSIFEEVDAEYGRILGKPFVREEFLEYRKIVISILESLEHLNPKKIAIEKRNLLNMDISEFEKKHYSKIKLLSARAIRLYLTLFFLNIITIPHSSFSRYPYPKINVSPNGLYSRKLPLVKMLPHLFERQKETLSECKYFMKNVARKKRKS